MYPLIQPKTASILRLLVGTEYFGPVHKNFVSRRKDSRNAFDTVYRMRYVIPSNGASRPPIDGFIVQESNTSIGLLLQRCKYFEVVLSIVQLNRETIDSFQMLIGILIKQHQWNFHQLSIGLRLSW